MMKKAALAIFILSVIFLASCASVPKQIPKDNLKLYTVEDDGTPLARFAPVFAVENPQIPHNRIGTPRAQRLKNGDTKVWVDPETPTLYAEARTFSTPKNRYTNLVYRIHFEQVPLGLAPFYIGKGKNVGLVVVITLNPENQPVLYTTVHTCGCYLAFIPTSYMPETVFPPEWEKTPQDVYGEVLPGFIDHHGTRETPGRLVILIKNDTHRVKHVKLSDLKAPGSSQVEIAHIQPLDALEKLVLKNGGTTSFYETRGPRKGFVKGSHKPWERLFMSWWAFDWRIGEDKKLGKNTGDGPLFYTSLKPWARKASDMRNFAVFSDYWGWRF